MHPSKSKLMVIGSSYYLDNQNIEQPVVVNDQNDVPVSRINTHNYKCLAVQINEKLSLESSVDVICNKASVGIGAMKCISKGFCCFKFTGKGL